jgi:hypothetical protein
MKGAVAPCQPARDLAGASMPGKPLISAPAAIAPWVGASKPSSTARAAAIGTARRAPRRSAGPGALGPIAKSGEARSSLAFPEALKRRDDGPRSGTALRVT